MRYTASKNPLRRALNRKGVTSAMFAASAVALLSMTALGTDVGLWYFSLRNARSAADAAAMAGTATTAAYDTSRGIAAARAIAASNGFSDGTSGAIVTVNVPPSTGGYMSSPGAVEVIVQQRQGRFFSTFFTSGDPNLTVRAVAARVNLGDACVLALGGSGLQIGGNSTVASPGCILGSNKTGADSVRIFGSATVNAESIKARGECDGCSIATLTTPFQQYGAPSTNPFAALDTKAMPNSVPNGNCSPSVVLNGSGATATLQPTIAHGTAVPNTLTRVVCSNVIVSVNQTLTLQAGVYYFWNSSLRVSGGSVSCSNCTAGSSGVTLVFTGDPNNIGTLRMDGNGTINLFASPNQPDSAYNGILAYRDIRATSDSGFNATIINGGSGATLNGGLYFPSSSVTFNGNMANGPHQCSSLVALGITMSGTSATTLNNSGCATYRTGISLTQVVRLVE